MPAIELRVGEMADANAIGQLVNSAYSKWVSVLGRKPVPMTVDYQDALERHDFLLALVDKEIVGLIETVQIDEIMWIENLAISPSWQGRGIASQLMEYRYTEAVTAGLTELQLQTNEVFQSNISMYQHMGFEISRKEPFQKGTTVFMSKKVCT